MHLQTSLVLFCTITVLFIDLNNGASTESTSTKITPPTKSTTTKKTAPTKTTKAASRAKQILLGGHTPWDTKIKAKHQKIFDDYLKIISKKLQEIHKVPASFIPKPHKFSVQVVGGINYLYLVKLPINKYAFVSIHDRAWNKTHYGKEENVQIRPQTYELNDKKV